jgi:excisionase family DNA binding protein
MNLEQCLVALSQLPTLIERLERLVEQSGAAVPDEVMKTAEVARLLRVGEAEILERARSGRLPSWEMGNGRRYSRQQVLEAVRAEATALGSARAQE